MSLLPLAELRSKLIGCLILNNACRDRDCEGAFFNFLYSRFAVALVQRFEGFRKLF